MQRRNAIKSLSAIALGISLFPACSDGLAFDMTADNIHSFSKKQGIWIEAISEAILPKESSLISTFESFPEFVFKMVSFSKSEKDQQSFFNGYNRCTSDIKSINDTKTNNLTEDQIVNYFNSVLNTNRSEVDKAMDEITEMNEENLRDQILFCQTLRTLAIQHLTTSKEYQEQVLEYKLVPDTYQSCVQV